jgi:DNA-binding transcriptional regulator YdaS (Cro superfamily)
MQYIGRRIIINSVTTSKVVAAIQRLSCGQVSNEEIRPGRTIYGIRARRIAAARCYGNYACDAQNNDCDPEIYQSPVEKSLYEKDH